MKTYRKAATAWLVAKLERAWDRLVGWVTNWPMYRRFDAWRDAHPWKFRVVAGTVASVVLLVAVLAGVSILTPEPHPGYALISPHDVIVSVPPPVPAPISASPKDLPPLSLIKAVDVKVVKVKKAATKRKAKPRVSSARSDTRF